MSKNPPNRIWLQWFCEEHDSDWGNPDPGDITWCQDKIFNDDIEYIRQTKESSPLPDGESDD